ncbi:MAG TPA: DUF5680 domain-containing protein [Patescibacteria group bacterium]|nr:DUF5680 domain-containing protein [Patescibacteria group bacterium]
MNPYPFTQDQLLAFIDKAGKATYAGGGKEEDNPEKPGFIELVFEEDNFSYRDSYTGYLRSRGMEVVRYKSKPVWIATYGGGMVEEFEDFPHECFEFLKKALSSRKNGLMRGPNFKERSWEHKYTQEGDLFEFSGYEEILHEGKVIFFHRIIGGIIVNKK